jgi:hypothetical protein
MNPQKPPYCVAKKHHDRFIKPPHVFSKIGMFHVNHAFIDGFSMK